jgi:hypothetical protein
MHPISSIGKSLKRHGGRNRLFNVSATGADLVVHNPFEMIRNHMMYGDL